MSNFHSSVAPWEKRSIRDQSRNFGGKLIVSNFYLRIAVKRKEIWDIFSSNMMFILFYFISLCSVYAFSLRSSFCFLPHLVTAHTFRATGHFHFMLIALFRFEDYFTYLFAASVYVCCFVLCCTAGRDSATVFKCFIFMALTVECKEKLISLRMMRHSLSLSLPLSLWTSIKDTKNHFISRTEKHSSNSFWLHQQHDSLIIHKIFVLSWPHCSFDQNFEMIFHFVSFN